MSHAERYAHVYDQDLAHRVRIALAGAPDVDTRLMFGGIAFMVGGHMACGVIGQDLMLRLGPEATQRALREPNVRPMDFTGRPSGGNGPHRRGRHS
jgi:TfoX/Sxy family transcriptional regulator of competence genes